MPVISVEEAILVMKLILPSLQMMLFLEFDKKNIRVPDFEWNNGMKQFFDSALYKIVVGIVGIIQMFHPKNAEELRNDLKYVVKHEIQHVCSTASEPYARAIQEGVHAVIRYVSNRFETPKRSFLRPCEYSDCIAVLQKQGIYVNWNGLEKTVAHIANSLEDGRIERIRSVRDFEFALLRKVSRGKIWNDGVPHPSMEDIKKSPVVHLHVLLNEILSLATCQLYTNGFFKAYAGTAVIDEVDELKPYIARAVMAGSVRQEVPEIVGICEKLAPLLYEAFVIPESDVQKMKDIEKMIKDILSSMVGADASEFDLNEKDEETDDGSIESVFGHSDLVVTLPDEVYDKLMEKAKTKKENKGGNIMIRREHPKEQEPEDGENSSDKQDGEKEDPGKDAGEQSGRDGSGDGSADGGDDGRHKPKTEDGEAGDGHAGGPSNEEDGNGNSTSADQGEPGTSGNSGLRPDAGDEDQHSGSGQDQDADGSGSVQDQDSQADGHPEKTGQCGHGASASDGLDGTEDDRAAAIQHVLDQIQEAEEEAESIAREEALRSITSKGTDMLRKMQNREVKDTDPALTDAEMREAMEGTQFSFVEVKRSYENDAMLPVDIEARGKTLRIRIEQYFKSLKSPNIRFREKGKLDPTRLHALVMQDTRLFMKNGENRGFDGCAYILIDNSGSMSCGTKFKDAMTAAAIIEEGFKGLFPFKIVSFNDNYKSVVHQVIKGWDEKLHKNCSWNYYKHKGPEGGNADGCSIKVATKELLQRPERKKILIVLSDGMPTEGGANPVQLTKDAIREARKKHISVSGIYFEAGEINRHGDASKFSEIYERDYIAVPSNEIDRELIRIMEKFSRS